MELLKIAFLATSSSWIGFLEKDMCLYGEKDAEEWKLFFLED